MYAFNKIKLINKLKKVNFQFVFYLKNYKASSNKAFRTVKFIIFKKKTN